jgi:hypothetical protein
MMSANAPTPISVVRPKNREKLCRREPGCACDDKVQKAVDPDAGKIERAEGAAVAFELGHAFGGRLEVLERPHGMGCDQQGEQRKGGAKPRHEQAPANIGNGVRGDQDRDERQEVIVFGERPDDGGKPQPQEAGQIAALHDAHDRMERRHHGKHHQHAMGERHLRLPHDLRQQHEAGDDDRPGERPAGDPAPGIEGEEVGAGKQEVLQECHGGGPMAVGQRQRPRHQPVIERRVRVAIAQRQIGLADELRLIGLQIAGQPGPDDELQGKIAKDDERRPARHIFKLAIGHASLKAWLPFPAVSISRPSPPDQQKPAERAYTVFPCELARACALPFGGPSHSVVIFHARMPSLRGRGTPEAIPGPRSHRMLLWIASPSARNDEECS